MFYLQMSSMARMSSGCEIRKGRCSDSGPGERMSLLFSPSCLFLFPSTSTSKNHRFNSDIAAMSVQIEFKLPKGLLRQQTPDNTGAN